MTGSDINLNLSQEVSRLGARDMELCMQCAVCSASCPLSSGANAFPRKIYRYLQLGLEDKLLASPEPWLCYYCGECNKDCPRGAEPAETMMAARRWLITRYDWTGLSRRFYSSPVWQVGAFAVVALGIILAFCLGHGPMVTERVELTTFAPVAWIQLGDKIMLSTLGALLLSNGFRMFRAIMGDVKPPLWLYITQAWAFVFHYLTQMRWRKCGTDRSRRWVRHLLLFSGYVTMEVLVVAFLDAFQTDVVHPMWHPTRIFGYYATIALMIISAEMMISRRQKKETLHRYSDFTDWFFLLLLFLTAFSGILVHGFRLAGWPLMTYATYVVHLAIAVGMLCIMLPFGKLSHLFYRPLAIFLTSVRQKASPDTTLALARITAEAGELFQSCLQCGTCTSLCPSSREGSFSPRQVLRRITLESGTERSVDQAAWDCLTCNACTPNCPRGIGIIDVIKAVRGLAISAGKPPVFLKTPLISLREKGNPWDGASTKRLEWSRGSEMPAFSPDHEYCLFTCCTTAYDPGSHEGGRALVQVLEKAGVSFGTLGTRESCCGDQARQAGATAVFAELAQNNTDLFVRAGVKKILTTSPHCLNAFKNAYGGLKGVGVEHYTELLDRLLGADRLTPAVNVALTVTYHDPCYLGRHNGIYEAPRRALLRIPGLVLVEMASNREYGLCCGGGAANGWRTDPGSRRFGQSRIEEGLAAGAQVIATACPYCVRMLSAAAKNLGVGDRIAVMDIAQLLLKSVMVTDEAHGQKRVHVNVDQEI
jgi:quinone-modifying oxidoreductase subunit QmoC